MIEKVLEAYEARIVGRKTFAQKLSKMDKITKAVFWGVIISAIVLFICGFIIPKPALLVVMSVYGAVVYIVTLVLERIHRKKWESNLKEYNIELNLLAELLKEKDCNGVQREHNKKLNNGLPILHKVPPKRDYGRYFCIMAEKGGTSHGGLTEKLSPFFHAKKQEVNAYGR